MRLDARKRGRGEKRTVWVSEQLALVDASTDWVGLKSVVCVASRRWLDGKEQYSKTILYQLIDWLFGDLDGALYLSSLEY